jgi:hypothetical protein
MTARIQQANTNTHRTKQAEDMVSVLPQAACSCDDRVFNIWCEKFWVSHWMFHGMSERVFGY